MRDFGEEWKEHQAEKWAASMTRALGDRLNQHNEIFWNAVELAYPRLYEEHVESIEEFYGRAGKRSRVVHP